MTVSDCHRISEYLIVAACYMRRLADRDTFNIRQSEELSKRNCAYADDAMALARNLKEEK